MGDQSDDLLAVENFRKYLQIPSVPPKFNYDLCVEFLQDQAKSLSLPISIIRVKPHKPVAIITWKGSDENLRSIFLNSHMDVVPVEEDKWAYPPFEAHMDEKGNIYGRGTQDMKSVGIQYLEAIRRLKKQGIQLKRTLHVCFVPDEEIGGKEGMKLFVETREFRDLNVGLGLDECGPSLIPNTFFVSHGEKHKWTVKFRCTGAVGHGFTLLEDTAAPKLSKLLKQLHDFREEQSALIDSFWNTGNVVSINVTMIEGGKQDNVIPSEFVVTADIRLPPNKNPEEWRNTLQNMCTASGEGVTVEEVQCEVIDVPTKIDDSNPFWTVFNKTIQEMGYNTYPVIIAGVSDARYLRSKGIPVFGFSPILDTEFLLHAHNEYLNKNVFLKGIDIYCKLLVKLGNLTHKQ